MHDTSKKTKQIGAELVVRALEAHGVTHIFGIPGAKIDTVFNALVDSKIKTVVCRHEQNATFIAGGIGRMTGKAGVAIATSGPGVSNMTTGLATANSEGDPVVALGGSVATSEALKQVHQTMDAVSILKPNTFRRPLARCARPDNKLSGPPEMHVHHILICYRDRPLLLSSRFPR